MKRVQYKISNHDFDGSLNNEKYSEASKYLPVHENETGFYAMKSVYGLLCSGINLVPIC